MRLRPTAILIVGALLVPAAARVEAQSLADAAAREKEKRKAQKPAKVFTEDDLRRAGSSGRASVVTGDPAGAATTEEGAAVEGADGAVPTDEPAATPKKAEKTSAELRAENQTAWRAKLDKAQAELAAATSEVTRIQGYIAGLSPESTGALANFNARLKEQQDRVTNARAQVDALETEGRHNGYR